MLIYAATCLPDVVVSSHALVIQMNNGYNANSNCGQRSVLDWSIPSNKGSHHQCQNMNHAHLTDGCYHLRVNLIVGNSKCCHI